MSDHPNVEIHLVMFLYPKAFCIRRILLMLIGTYFPRVHHVSSPTQHGHFRMSLDHVNTDRSVKKRDTREGST